MSEPVAGVKLYVMSVYDQMAGAFLQPFFTTTKGEAMRSFADAVGSGDHQFAKHPEDYSLHVLGVLDTAAGTFENMSPVPERVALAMDFVKDDLERRRRVGGA